MSKASAAHWVKFFNASGIPSPAAATYAHIFVENRIQNDMIMDLNKDYLREMGITPMGDIIAILRHAKAVSDQTARERVLGTDSFIPVAAIAASPAVPSIGSTKKISLKASSTSSNGGRIKKSSMASSSSIGLELPLPKAPRRVLPEHEGKYKIRLPTGTTERSKEILAKRDKLYSNSVTSSRKSDVFSRLEKHSQGTSVLAMDVDDSEDIVSSSGSNESTKMSIQVTGVSSASNGKRSTVFARLGGKDERKIAQQIKPILKNAHKGGSNSKTIGIHGIVKAKNVAAPLIRPQQQKVLLVHKVPVKRGDSEDDSYSDDDFHSNYRYGKTATETISTGNEKFVKFASTAEVREIEPISNYRREAAGVKSRLGSFPKIHATKKTYNMKATSTNTRNSSPVKGKTIRLKSDEMLSRQELPVHQRLGNSGSVAKKRSLNMNNNEHASNSFSSSSSDYRNKKRRNSSPNFGNGSDRRKKSVPSSSTSSVFHRLGFNSSI